MTFASRLWLDRNNNSPADGRFGAQKGKVGGRPASAKHLNRHAAWFASERGRRSGYLKRYWNSAPNVRGAVRLKLCRMRCGTVPATLPACSSVPVEPS